MKIRRVVFVLLIILLLLPTLASCSIEKNETETESLSSILEEGKGIPIEYVRGLYNVEMKSEQGYTNQFKYVFEKYSKDELMLQNGTIYQYDQSTSTAVYSYEKDGEKSKITFQFKAEGEGIYLNGSVEKDDIIIMSYDGFKVEE